MKIVNVRIKGIICCISLLLLLSCNKFLDKTDKSNYTLNTFFTDAGNAERSVNAIYGSVYPIYQLQSWMIALVRTGTVNTNFPDDAGFPNLTLPRDLGNFSEHRNLSTLWNTYYDGVANSNLAIENIPGITMDETRKKQLLGEAHFLRAYFYFDLVRMFGNIPLINASINDLANPKLQPSASTVDSIYDLIVNDLKTAESSGLPFSDATGRVSLGAVKAMLSTVYMTMAGYPLQKGVEYYKLARDKAKEVIDAGVFSLFDSYQFLRDPTFNNQKEYIFEIQFDENNHPNNTLQEAIIPYRRGISKYSAEEGFVFVLDEFVNSFEHGDKRAAPNEFFFDRYTSNANRNDSVYFDHFYIHKFLNKVAIEQTAKSSLNWPILRYPEVLLNYAESSNEVDGPNPDAYNAINKIRERAGLPDLSGLSQDEFRKAVWIEQYHEMCFENKVWFLMARTRKALDMTNMEFKNYVGFTFPYGVTLQERDLLFPIPLPELQVNPNLHQNPGF